MARGFNIFISSVAYLEYLAISKGMMDVFQVEKVAGSWCLSNFTQEAENENTALENTTAELLALASRSTLSAEMSVS